MERLAMELGTLNNRYAVTDNLSDNLQRTPGGNANESYTYLVEPTDMGCGRNLCKGGGQGFCCMFGVPDNAGKH
jgi:hypothetical protein